MDDLTVERSYTDAKLQAEVRRAAERERARVLKRFLEQAAQALLGDRRKRARVERLEPCPTC